MDSLAHNKADVLLLQHTLWVLLGIQSAKHILKVLHILCCATLVDTLWVVGCHERLVLRVLGLRVERAGSESVQGEHLETVLHTWQLRGRRHCKHFIRDSSLTVAFLDVREAHVNFALFTDRCAETVRIHHESILVDRVRLHGLLLELLFIFFGHAEVLSFEFIGPVGLFRIHHELTWLKLMSHFANFTLT